MNKKIFTLTLLMASLCISAQATLFLIDLSPTPGAALSLTNYTNGDHAIGLSALNAVGQPVSPATGGEIGGGITFDDVSKLLSLGVGYGSDFGFIDLAGSFTIAHVHGPIAVQFPSLNTGAGVRLSLTHTAGSSVNTGSFTGSTTLSAADETSLMNNLLYINVHSTFAAGGEIRGQLVPVAVPEPASFALLMVGFFALRRRFHFTAA